MLSNIDMRAINAIRVLSADTIQKANSGHPGLPLGVAPCVYELWANHMRHNPSNPNWIDRDRFILSAGHGSSLLYSLFHLFGYGNLSISDLQNFRQLNSLTPGHPEYGHTVGVEATTGPLGAGMGMAVGMAMAERHLAAIFNEENYDIIDHYTYVLGGDGCMMEGISSEAFSLAGTLGLSKLIVFYDSNNISIEGDTDFAFTEDVQKRMEAFGFQVLTVEDGNDIVAISNAIKEAKQDKIRPSFITIKTQIGYGCPKKQGTASAHGEPLGVDNIKEMKEFLQYENKDFFIPDEVYTHYKSISNKLTLHEEIWNSKFREYCHKFPEKKLQWDKYFSKTHYRELDDDSFWYWDDKAQATRNISGSIINRLKNIYPNLVGGSADLAPSNKTMMIDVEYMNKDDFSGRNIHFGVRELAMTAETNGIILHGGLRAYCATFFVFSDYTKPMARLASLMKIPTIFVFTHDSIGVGEDGPTHEPIEQLAMFRAMPNFNTFRPADATETIAAWYSAMKSEETPTAIILTRQNLPQLKGSSKKALKGAYIIKEAANNKPDVILIASGSEVHLCIEASNILEDKNINVRVVSMPSSDIFDKQDQQYKESILPSYVKSRVFVEALSSYGLERYVGLEGKIIAMNSFGDSAPQEQLFKRFGFTVDNIINNVLDII